ncbi:MAG: HDOD domain-containing protein [Chloroflexota bacterium]|nr:HDOD domain-containing protein [Chloroflexota bacterium]
METSSATQGSELETVLARIGTLPTPTRVFDQVTSMLANPKTSAKEIAEVVSADQSITARLLKMVNSPFFGLAEEVTTVSRAITIIGFGALRNLILASSLMDLFTSRLKGRAFFNIELLWTHSWATGVAARAIAKRTGHSAEAEEYLVAGLMHDVGKLALLQYLPERVEAILEKVVRQRCLFIEGEREVLGTDHTVIGAAIADQWRLPAALRDVIAMHHVPSQAADVARAATVQLADVMARALLLGSGGDRSMPSLDGEAYKLLRLDDQKLQGIMRDVERGLAANSLAFLM